MDLVLTNKERLVGSMKLKDSLGSIEKFKILRAARRVDRKLTALRTSGKHTLASSGIFSLFIVGYSPEKKKGPRKLFNIQDHIFQVQKRCIPTERKLGRFARRPA